ncbi:hypothetical protein F5884DRAFT_788460 [Xylogone sp. PMI_703]|nr:hypothetical protein F5884DRAFT_788460 [Xylogone sp. PMI_703]
MLSELAKEFEEHQRETQKMAIEAGYPPDTFYMNNDLLMHFLKLGSTTYKLWEQIKQTPNDKNLQRQYIINRESIFQEMRNSSIPDFFAEVLAPKLSALGEAENIPGLSDNIEISTDLPTTNSSPVSYAKEMPPRIYAIYKSIGGANGHLNRALSGRLTGRHDKRAENTLRIADEKISKICSEERKFNNWPVLARMEGYMSDFREIKQIEESCIKNDGDQALVAELMSKKEAIETKHQLQEIAQAIIGDIITSKRYQAIKLKKLDYPPGNVEAILETIGGRHGQLNTYLRARYLGTEDSGAKQKIDSVARDIQAACEHGGIEDTFSPQGDRLRLMEEYFGNIKRLELAYASATGNITQSKLLKEVASICEKYSHPESIADAIIEDILSEGMADKTAKPNSSNSRNGAAGSMPNKTNAKPKVTFSETANTPRQALMSIVKNVNKRPAAIPAPPEEEDFDQSEEYYSSEPGIVIEEVDGVPTEKRILHWRKVGANENLQVVLTYQRPEYEKPCFEWTSGIYYQNAVDALRAEDGDQPDKHELKLATKEDLKKMAGELKVDGGCSWPRSNSKKISKTHPATLVRFKRVKSGKQLPYVWALRGTAIPVLKKDFIDKGMRQHYRASGQDKPTRHVPAEYVDELLTKEVSKYKLRERKNGKRIYSEGERALREAALRMQAESDDEDEYGEDITNEDYYKEEEEIPSQEDEDFIDDSPQMQGMPGMPGMPDMMTMMAAFQQFYQSMNQSNMKSKGMANSSTKPQRTNRGKAKSSRAM